jgi:hypothetical protein
VHPDKPRGVRELRAHVRDEHRARVRREHRGRGRHALGLREHALLQREVLRHRLDDEVRVAECALRIDRACHAPEGRVRVGLRELLLADELVEAPSDALHRAVHDPLVDVAQPHLEAAERGELRDPVTHVARAKNGDDVRRCHAAGATGGSKTPPWRTLSGNLFRST